MTRKIVVNGRAAWCKTYDRSAGSRQMVASLWNRLVGWLDVEPLRSPPRPAGDDARQLEQRRITQLHGQGVLVPDVVGEGRRLLLLSDLGPTLSSCLKQTGGTREVDDLVHRSVKALVDVHRRGAYLGQAVARNIVMTGSGVGFIDFEEDPLEVMSLTEAQARDWLLFSSSVARHYEGREDALTAMFGRALPEVGNDVAMMVDRAAWRLGFLEKLTGVLGHRARALGVAVSSLRNSRLPWYAALLMLADFISDGDSDILLLLQQLL